MTAGNALGRLFPAALFSIFGTVMCLLWRSDPVLVGTALCVAAFSASWLVITIVEVSRGLRIAPPHGESLPQI